LGGNRLGAARTYVHLLLVFVLCGLWHGASWTFLVWGLWHGAFLVLERAGLGRILEKCPSPVRHGYTLLAVLGGWVFFASPNLGQALAYGQSMFGLSNGSAVAADFWNREIAVALALGSLFCMPVMPWLRTSLSQAPMLKPALEFAKLGIPFVLLLASTVYLASGTYNPFIYFRF